MLTSPAFAEDGPLLTLLVESALEGTPHGVPADVGRLRSKLEEYYDSVGKDDAIRIALPEGSNVPVFSRLETVQLPGYQPSPGRKLFMLILCLLALIAVWIFYFITSRQPAETAPKQGPASIFILPSGDLA